MKEYMLDDTSIYVGENDADNDRLVQTCASPSFIWLHLAKFPSGHVIINSDQIDNLPLIRFAAKLCKTHTKYRDIPKLYVIYTPVQNVQFDESPDRAPGSVTFASNRQVRQIQV